MVRVAARAWADLGRTWRTLSTDQRERAIHELAAALAAVHATRIEVSLPPIEPPHTLPLAPLLALVDQVATLHGRNLDELATVIRDRWAAFDDHDTGLVHGDPHFENVLWDGTQVSALLDFEWSRPSWIHADLEILLSISANPALFASADHEASVDPVDYAGVPGWLRAAQPRWFEHPRLHDRLEILHASRVLGGAIDAGAAPLESELARLESWNAMSHIAVR